MASNCLAPGFVRVFYNSNTHEHRMTIPVFPVLPAGASTLLYEKGGATLAWLTGITAVITVIKARYPAAASFETAEIWTQADCESVPLLQDTQTLGIAGTLGSGATAYMQSLFTFRTQFGGRGKLMLMEPGGTVDVKSFPPTFGGDAALQAISDYVIGSTSIVYARDNSFNASAIKYISKVNDKLRKKYLNP